MPLQIVRQDITKIKCDAIVNPTNTDLYPTGGLDLAVHKAAGKELLNDCQRIKSLNTGEAVITSGYNLPCKYVIHTAGPVWQDGTKNEEELLISCYKSSLRLALEKGLQSLAIPLISSGTYGYPKDRVLSLALKAISNFLFSNDIMVYLVVFDKTSYTLSKKLFEGIRTFIDDNYAQSRIHSKTQNRFQRSQNPCEGRMPLPCASMAQPSICDIPDQCTTEEYCICEKPSAELDDFIKLDESFAVKLMKLIDAKGMDDVECYKKANVSKQTWYKIMNTKHYKPNKKTVISFAIALNLTLDETQNLLESVGFVLSNSSLFDVIIMYCLKNQVYNVWEIDSILFKYDQETLYSK